MQSHIPYILRIVLHFTSGLDAINVITKVPGP